MNFGVSSSCFYPSLIEESLKSVGRSGAKTAEIFFNSLSELSGDVFNELCRIKEYYNIEVRSIHPFTSAFEPIMFFSGYGDVYQDYMVENAMRNADYQEWSNAITADVTYTVNESAKRYMISL